ncbi:hypothetical protein [Pseudooctadecabacter sp.]|uniref:hypothetical protein n=1 Tax=Pseudooctadecabacter sp. TaxID=1966338 RepID=UPI003F6BA3FC
MLVIAALAACTGGTIAAFMPGETVTVQGVPFTVSDTGRGVTVRNFETGLPILPFCCHMPPSPPSASLAAPSPQSPRTPA